MALKKRKTNLHLTYPSHPHRYPTRFISQALRKKTTEDNHWGLRSHSSHSQEKAKDQLLVACKKRKVERHTLDLSREKLFNILLLVSVDVLHEVVRYVCKQWYHIVRDPLFVSAHTKISSSGLLTQDLDEVHQCYYMEGDTAKLKLTLIQLPLPAKIYGSFNGLVLLHDMTNTQLFHVMNLVTKQHFTLPPFVGLKLHYGSTGFVLDSSGHYKVVHVTGSKIRSYQVVQVQMKVFTVGVDKAWRSIDLQHITMNSVKVLTLLHRPLFIAGFLYWFSTVLNCFALDVETETIYQFSGPKDWVSDGFAYDFVNMGTGLGLMKSGIIHLCMLWKLTDVKSGEWTPLAGIKMGAVIRRVDKVLHPSKCIAFAPLRIIDGDIWFYRRVDEEFVVVRYNLANDSFVFFRIKTVCHFITTLDPHVHTLLSPKNCFA